ncbi:hypothetical protein ACHAXS_008086 [Conticribra weissflogii]
MGGGLAFLTKKSFNPANWSNQRRVWEARQQNEAERRRLAEREAQVKREREEEDLARMIGGEEEGGRKALGFMYEGGRIPGLKREDRRCGNADDGEENERFENELVGGSEKEDDIGNVHCDDAAAAFRNMLARGAAASDDIVENAAAGSTSGAASAGTTTDDQQQLQQQKQQQQGSKDHRTNLEKIVGRGINAGSGVTLAQQMERFPMLKGAPMVLQKPNSGAGKSGGGEDGGDENATAGANVVGLNFKPLGQVLRNVQCLKCGKWGHARGDRECELSGWDPFRVSSISTSTGAAAIPDGKGGVAAASAKEADRAIDVAKDRKTKSSQELKNPDLDDENYQIDQSKHSPRKSYKRKREFKERKHRRRHRSKKKYKRRERERRDRKRRRRSRSPSYSSESSASSRSSYFSFDTSDSRDARRQSSKRRREEDYDNDYKREHKRNDSDNKVRSRRHDDESRRRRRRRSRSHSRSSDKSRTYEKKALISTGSCLRRVAGSELADG